MYIHVCTLSDNVCILIDAHLSDGDQLVMLYNIPHCEQCQGGSEAK